MELVLESRFQNHLQSRPVNLNKIVKKVLTRVKKEQKSRKKQLLQIMHSILIKDIVISVQVLKGGRSMIRYQRVSFIPFVGGVYTELV